MLDNLNVGSFKIVVLQAILPFMMREENKHKRAQLVHIFTGKTI